MTQIPYTLVSNEGESNVIVYLPGAPAPLIAHSTHPNYRNIVSALIAGTADESIADEFDVAEAITSKLSKLSERVSTSNGVVYFDGDEVDNAVAKQILRFLRAGDDDWKPLVKFMENLAANPSAHSRDQFYAWLSTKEFTITDEGFIVGYKGVQVGANGYESITRGPAVVDGEAVNGNVPNYIGAVVEIARSYVNDDPSIGCSTGLHVGTWDYASSFARGAVLEVHFNPRDVVSVPTDCEAQKVRVSRYTVVDVTEVPYNTALLGGSGDYPDESDYDDWFADDACDNLCDCGCQDSTEPEPIPVSTLGGFLGRFNPYSGR